MYGYGDGVDAVGDGVVLLGEGKLVEGFRARYVESTINPTETKIKATTMTESALNMVFIAIRSLFFGSVST